MPERPRRTSARPHGARRQSGPRRPRPARPERVSALDRALAEALARPEPEPRTFAQLDLPDPLIQALQQRGIRSPFAIQARTLPDALAGRDVLGRAQTGSGKTLAFGLPTLSRLHRDGGRSGAGRPRALVLVPTRELAQQVADELGPLGRAVGVTVAAVYGGAPIARQIAALARGVDVLVATPGRLLDLMERRSAALADTRIVVIDEADHMADLGFLPDVTRILETTPAGGQRLLFSATLDRGVDRLVQRFLSDPAVHAIAPTTAAVDSMRHQVLRIDPQDKVAVAAQIASRPARTLFFVRTKHGADRLARQLGRAGVAALAIHGNRSQNQRQRALEEFADGRTRVLVATDVAARGIHVDDVDLVVHFDPAGDHKDYLHRSGRTARAGASGTVVSLVDPAQAADLAKVHRAAAVTADVATVHVGHPLVQGLAESGEPIRVRPVTRPAANPAPKRPARNSNRRRNPRARAS
ncbi:MAG TPA: DEAD/DEAH box helicase [Mycobacteriales bacterium]|nr:DEAD/DEAH box helicase [Mycobacteriales bacterium]